MQYKRHYDLCAAALYDAKLYGGSEADIARAKAIIDELCPDITDFVFMSGVVSVVERWRKLNPPADPVLTPAERKQFLAAEARAQQERIERNSRAIAPLLEAAKKIEAYDKVVDLLDKWLVDGVRLGDCTKDKLIAASAKLDHAAAHARRQAGVYKKVAGHLKPGETVRQADNRGLVLDTLKALLA